MTSNVTFISLLTFVGVISSIAYVLIPYSAQLSFRRSLSSQLLSASPLPQFILLSRSMASPYAIVTLVSSDSYLPGALALVAALKDLHNSPPVELEVDFQTLCLVTPESVDVSTIRLLRKAFDVVIGVEILEHENIKGLKLLGEHFILSLSHRLLFRGNPRPFRGSRASQIIFAYLVHLPPKNVAN